MCGIRLPGQIFHLFSFQYQHVQAHHYCSEKAQVFFSGYQLRLADSVFNIVIDLKCSYH